jgi:hypothetical protein
MSVLIGWLLILYILTWKMRLCYFFMMCSYFCNFWEMYRWHKSFLWFRTWMIRSESINWANVGNGCLRRFNCCISLPVKVESMLRVHKSLSYRFMIYHEFAMFMQLQMQLFITKFYIDLLCCCQCHCCELNGWNSDPCIQRCKSCTGNQQSEYYLKIFSIDN